MTTLLVCIPCLNEEKNLELLFQKMPAKIEGIDQYDVLVVDDGSTDNTADVASAHGAHLIRHGQNRGVGAAFASAAQYALEHNYSMMVNMDGDNQFDPSDLAVLCKPVVEGQADMSTASRFISEDIVPIGIPKIKLYGNRLMSFLISGMVGHRYHDVSCGFRCYGREALLRLTLSGMFTYTQESFIDLSVKHLRIVEVPIKVVYYPERKSRVAGNLLKYGIKTLNIILRSYRDYFPLRFFWSLALILLVPAITFGFVFLHHYVATGFFSGALYAGFSSAFLFILSLIFFIMGILADMFVRLRINQENILYRLRK